ncbi:SDR family oxidoreductase [Chryseobacterium sp. B21-037]|uniref:SDR family NAD(P)-dependent oxidoreductase n=1 Tax=Chryseobacterium sp. B21-037 TaxID=2926038 RepID=UPI00235877CF|nr:SDR family oxidoreductase [Chryseobacterium sp. B21-037]MDC8103971.1 SDR family oxidoreductase [Chryseobacterium sp. B21-037]
MEKQTVIITGASSGIGLEIARYFLEKGSNVVINSRTESKLQKVFNELGGGDHLAMIAGDVADKAIGELLVKTAIERFGSADVLVNNAGIYENKPFLEVTEDHLDRFLRTNLKGTFFTTQSVIPQMQKQRNGVIINIGSPLVYHAMAGSPSTAPISSKGAIHALTHQLATEFGKDNIRVNTVAAGLIRTPMHDENIDQAAGIHLLNRIGEPEEVAQMVYSIACNKLITGAIINVDGGMGAGHYL